MDVRTICTLFQTLDTLCLGPLLGRTRHILSPTHHKALVCAIAQTRCDSSVYAPLNQYLESTVGAYVSAELISKVAAMYAPCYDPSAEFAVRPTVAYTGIPEFAIIAIVSLKKGAIVEGLTGVLAPLKCSPISPSSRRSVIVGRNREDMQLIGPISRVNHDCANFSCEFLPLSTLHMYQRVALRVSRDIAPGEELTVNYGPEYFGPGNQDCLCASCESRGCRGWGDGDVNATVREGRTRKASVDAKLESLKRKVYTLAKIKLPPGPRVPGDHSQVVAGMPSTRCIAPHCHMLFVGLPTGELCTCCREQVAALS